MVRARTTSPRGGRAAATALSAALSLLGARARTRAALGQRLLAKGFDAAQVDAALARVAELGYLDDAAHARRVAAKLLAQGHALASVEARLVAQQVEQAVAKRAVAAVVAEVGWQPEPAARALLRARRLSGPRGARLLLARGFDEEVARRAAGIDEA